MSFWTDLAGFTSTFVTVDGVRTRVLDSGPIDGGRRPVLFLHGRGGHAETFHRNLAAVAAQRRVVAIDLLGHGLTEQAGTTYDVDELTTHVEAAAEALDGGDGWDLVGQSLGAWAGVRAALGGAPFHRMVLIEPAGLQTDGERMADPRVRTAFEQGGQAFDVTNQETVRRRFAQLLHDPATCTDEMVDLRTRLYAQPGATAVHLAVRGADNDGRVLSDSELAGLTAPLLLVRGEHGHLPPARYAQVAAAVPGCRVLTVPGAKQWPHYERPDVVNPSLIDHFER